jgi:outer membrane protein assembly factor BamB
VAASVVGRTIYVTGFTDDEGLWDGLGDLALVAYDTDTGQETWRASYALPVEDASGFGLAVTATQVFVCGQVQLYTSDGLRTEVLTVAHDVSDGAAVWMGRHSRTAPIGLGNGDEGNWAGLAGDGSRLFVGGDYANTFRVQEMGDFRDLGVLAYDVST